MHAQVDISTSSALSIKPVQASQYAAEEDVTTHWYSSTSWSPSASVSTHLQDKVLGRRLGFIFAGAPRTLFLLSVPAPVGFTLVATGWGGACVGLVTGPRVAVYVTDSWLHVANSYSSALTSFAVHDKHAVALPSAIKQVLSLLNAGQSYISDS